MRNRQPLPLLSVFFPCLTCCIHITLHVALHPIKRLTKKNDVVGEISTRSSSGISILEVNEREAWEVREYFVNGKAILEDVPRILTRKVIELTLVAKNIAGPLWWKEFRCFSQWYNKKDK